MLSPEQIKEYQKYKQNPDLAVFLMLEAIKKDLAEKANGLDIKTVQKEVIEKVSGVIVAEKERNRGIAFMTDADRNRLIQEVVDELVAKYESGLESWYRAFEGKDNALKEKILLFLESVKTGAEEAVDARCEEMGKMCVSNETFKTEIGKVDERLTALESEDSSEVSDEMDEESVSKEEFLDLEKEVEQNSKDRKSLEKDLNKNTKAIAALEKAVAAILIAIKGLGRAIRERRGGGSSSGNGGGMGNWVHERFDVSSATTTISIQYRVAANSNAILVRYEGQLLAHNKQYTISAKTISLTFTPDDSTAIDVTYVRT